MLESESRVSAFKAIEDLATRRRCCRCAHKSSGWHDTGIRVSERRLLIEHVLRTASFNEGAGRVTGKCFDVENASHFTAACQVCNYRIRAKEVRDDIRNWLGEAELVLREMNIRAIRCRDDIRAV